MIRYDVIDEPDGGARIEKVTSFSAHGIEQGFVMTIPAEHRQAVALALLSPSDSLTVRIDDAGAAHLLALDDDGDGCGITVPKERRREIAEKLMGGVTDEMVERAARALYWHNWSGELAMDNALHRVKEEYREQSRVMIAALFGEPA